MHADRKVYGWSYLLLSKFPFDPVFPQPLQDFRFDCGQAASVMSRSMQKVARHTLQMANGPVGDCRAHIAEGKFHLHQHLVHFCSRVKEKIRWLAAFVFAAE